MLLLAWVRAPQRLLRLCPSATIADNQALFRLFMELGPCSIVDGEGEGNFTTKVNPYAWNERANVFFLDEASTSFPCTSCRHRRELA